jgi:hypothetical protein
MEFKCSSSKCKANTYIDSSVISAHGADGATTRSDNVINILIDDVVGHGDNGDVATVVEVEHVSKCSFRDYALDVVEVVIEEEGK